MSVKTYKIVNITATLFYTLAIVSDVTNNPLIHSFQLKTQIPPFSVFLLM